MEVFSRPLYEAHIKLEYLLRTDRKSAKSFIATSFRAEKEILAFLNDVKAKRVLVPIEVRIRRSILRNLRLVGISQAELFAQKRWDVDGRNMRSLLNFLKRDLEYSFGFGASSHAVHGSWFDLWIHHLQKIDGRFYPEIRFGPTDPRYLTPPSKLLTDSLRAFLRYFGLDRTGMLEETISVLADYFRAFDGAWERTIARERAT